MSLQNFQRKAVFIAVRKLFLSRVTEKFVSCEVPVKNLELKPTALLETEGSARNDHDGGLQNRKDFSKVCWTS